MVTSTFEIVIIIFLLVGLTIAVGYYFIAYKYKTTLDKISFARGINKIASSSGATTLNFTCPAGKEICVTKINQICSDPTKSSSGIYTENSTTEPISGGLHSAQGTFGNFDPETTTNLTSSISASVNGKQSATFTFTPASKTTSGAKFACSGSTQVIGVYSCVPTGSKCK